MKVELTAVEARVIGCLLEKEVTTPDLYPLSLNALTNACNQKSNREPVLALSEAEVLDSVNALIERRLLSDESSFSSRVSKYQHRFCNTEFGDLQFSEQEKGIICCLLLRGAQTPGELRTRSQRLASFSDVKEVESVLDSMAQQGLVVKLAREAGKRESRYQHLFCDAAELTSALPVEAPEAVHDNTDRLANLEAKVAELKQQIAELRQLITDSQ